MLSKKLKKYLDDHYNEMVSLLERVVNIDSGSACKKGIDQIADIMLDEFEKEGFEPEVLHHENCGNGLIVRKKGTEKQLLMICHLDTAFPDGTAAKHPFRIDGKIATGPGVEDMKSCFVGCLYAWKALHALEVKNLPSVAVLFSGDEETGSHAVKEDIIKEGKKANWCIVTEGARENGAIVIGRKGNTYIHVTAKGRAVHAGIEPQKGGNAIEELALKIVKLRKLNDYENGASVTVTMIHGGENRIVVAEHAEMDIDLRYQEKEQGERLIREVKAILDHSEIENVHISYTLTMNRPPLTQVPGSLKLQELTRQISDELGIPYLTAMTGGVSDGNFVADLGIPTIDGMGPVGGLMCSPEEYLNLDTWAERTARMAAVIAGLSRLE
ncbi:MAG: M20 family metallopeptidase [Dorea sp.]|nr:M20 family metallopeptidase [Dorea sp.]